MAWLLLLHEPMMNAPIPVSMVPPDSLVGVPLLVIDGPLVAVILAIGAAIIGALLTAAWHELRAPHVAARPLHLRKLTARAT